MTKAEQQKAWEARIADYQASGQSVKEWCAVNGVTPRQLRYLPCLRRHRFAQVH